jgi:probable F420-dependent oxidoreductase
VTCRYGEFVTSITFALQAQCIDPNTWRGLAQNAEAAGFEAFVIADHPGVAASPFVALGAAATVTSTITLGTYVLNAGVRDPLHVAADVATLDLLSGGRAQLGIGAGHTPAEWTMTGHQYPRPSARVTRLRESVEVIQRLLAGDTVTFRGDAITTERATLDAPRPRRAHVPLLVGGNNHALLRFAAARADVVSIGGLGRTLADGHRHEVRWRDADVEETIATIRTAARDRADPPRVDALVQHVELTSDRDAAAARLAGRVPELRPRDALACPFVLIGTEAELVDEVRSHHERFGISRFTVRAGAFDHARRLIERLSQ